MNRNKTTTNKQNKTKTNKYKNNKIEAKNHKEVLKYKNTYLSCTDHFCFTLLIRLRFKST